MDWRHLVHSIYIDHNEDTIADGLLIDLLRCRKIHCVDDALLRMKLDAEYIYFLKLHVFELQQNRVYVSGQEVIGLQS